MISWYIKVFLILFGKITASCCRQLKFTSMHYSTLKGNFVIYSVFILVIFFSLIGWISYFQIFFDGRGTTDWEPLLCVVVAVLWYLPFIYHTFACVSWPVSAFDHLFSNNKWFEIPCTFLQCFIYLMPGCAIGRGRVFMLVAISILKCSLQYFPFAVSFLVSFSEEYLSHWFLPSYMWIWITVNQSRM